MAREIEVSYTDATDVDAIRDAAQVSRTRLVRIETPANSTWDITNTATAAGRTRSSRAARSQSASLCRLLSSDLQGGFRAAVG